MSKLYIKVVVLDIWRGGWGWQGEVELGYQKNRRKEMINMNMRNGTLENGALLDTNLDTTFLKVVAVISMLLDHVGGTFFPEYPVFRWIGRLAFPIFCYCMTVGMLYTRDIKRYLGRIAVFAVISQPFWILAFNPHDFWGNLTNWNIFFTLFISLLAVWGFKEKKWWLFAVSTFVICFWNFDYSFTGILLMLIFYLCRKKPVLGAVLYTLSYLPALFGGSLEDPLCWVVGGHPVGFEIFSLLALPFIYFHTNTSIKLPKWFFYVFYPAHLALIALVRYFMGF